MELSQDGAQASYEAGVITPSPPLPSPCLYPPPTHTPCLGCWLAAATVVLLIHMAGRHQLSLSVRIDVRWRHSVCSLVYSRKLQREGINLPQTQFTSSIPHVHVERCNYCKVKLFCVSMFFNLTKAVSKLQNTTAYLLWDQECSKCFSTLKDLIS